MFPPKLPRFAGIPPRPIIEAGCDCRTDHLLAEGRFVQAEASVHLALEARCRAPGVRA